MLHGNSDFLISNHATLFFAYIIFVPRAKFIIRYGDFQNFRHLTDNVLSPHLFS